jgi:methylthioribose-1-phosphate isomerase
MPIETIRWVGELPGFVRLIDQTRLPADLVHLEVRTVPAMVDAIRRLAVRGAPAIGVAAAYGVLLDLQHTTPSDAVDLVARVKETAAVLARARPTAVNLSWALERMIARAERELAEATPPEALLAALLDEAHAIFTEDRATCRRIGEIGAELLRDGSRVLTHCNAGALATADYGTALAPIYVAAEAGLRISVYAGETRPLLQGARLTAWELARSGIEVTLITDGMAGRVMFEKKVDAVFVGADRIARNGDVCNKIGTYSVAVLAREHGVPFYVCAPLSTFDARLAHGGLIPIEERAPEEVTEGFGSRTAPEGVRVYNPAFDVTPARLVSAIVTEAGILECPDTAKVEEALRRAGRL